MLMNLKAVPATTIKTLKHRKPKSWNKKQAIKNFTSQFTYPFDMKDDGIDLRAMSENFTNKIIPAQQVHEAILTVIGPKYPTVEYEVDPSFGGKFVYGKVKPKLYFTYIDWNQLYVWPIFQRDVAPNHVEKIYNDYDESSIIVPCVIKFTLKDGTVAHCIWDGHHTIQVCRMQGYKKFPGWVIDIDQYSVEEITANGLFDDSDEGRIDFGCYIAGKNARRINGLNKRQLSPYDDFLIGFETKDKIFVSMMNILRKHKCVPKRHATMAGAFTQIKSGIECYDLDDGISWDRALKVHRTNWEGSPLILELFRPLSYLYHRATVQGLQLPPAFDEELAALLIDKYGSADDIQEAIKESYWAAYHKQGALTGDFPEHDKFRVLSGLICLYNQNKGTVINRHNQPSITISGYLLPPADCQWKV